jgi:hypothetical protein
MIVQTRPTSPTGRGLGPRYGECVSFQFAEAIGLLLEYRWRSANAFPFQADIDFDTVGYLDEGNVAVHAVVFCGRPIAQADMYSAARPEPRALGRQNCEQRDRRPPCGHDSAILSAA